MSERLSSYQQSSYWQCFTNTASSLAANLILDTDTNIYIILSEFVSDYNNLTATRAFHFQMFFLQRMVIIQICLKIGRKKSKKTQKITFSTCQNYLVKLLVSATKFLFYSLWTYFRNDKLCIIWSTNLMTEQWLTHFTYIANQSTFSYKSKFDFQ